MVSKPHVSENNRHNEGAGNHAKKKKQQADKEKSLSRQAHEMSGFISFLASAFLFVVTFGFFIVYFTKGTYDGYRIALYWGIASFAFAGVGIFSAYQYYIIKPAKADIVSNKERPYVVFRATRLKPLMVGNYPVIEYELENISRVEVSVLLTDVTCQFTQDLKQTSFECLSGDEVKFTMVPTKRIYGQIRFPKHILIEEEIRALNQEPEQGRLAFYAREEYKDIAGGPTYPLNLCQLYNPYIDGNLTFCDPVITFSKPNEGDK